MDLIEMLDAIRRSKWIILISAVMVAIVVAVSGMLKPTLYHADAVLSVGSLGSISSLGKVGGEDKLAASYSELLNTSEVLEKASESTGFEITWANLKDSVEALTVKESPYIKLRSSDSSQSGAVKKANAMAQGLVEHISDLQVKNVEENRQKMSEELGRIEEEQNRIKVSGIKDEAQLKALDELRQALLKQYQQLISDTFVSNRLTVVSLADTATANSAHSLRNIVFGFLLGAVTGIGIGFARISISKALNQAMQATLAPRARQRDF